MKVTSADIFHQDTMAGDNKASKRWVFEFFTIFVLKLPEWCFVCKQHTWKKNLWNTLSDCGFISPLSRHRVMQHQQCPCFIWAGSTCNLSDMPKMDHSDCPIWTGPYWAMQLPNMDRYRVSSDNKNKNGYVVFYWTDPATKSENSRHHVLTYHAWNVIIMHSAVRRRRCFYS